jgi:hypothetical protein
VALEVGFVNGDVLDGDDALAGFHLEDAVDEEEGIAVGEEGHDLEDVHRGAGCGLLAGVLIGRCIGRGFAHGKDEYKLRALRGICVH